MGVRVRVRCRRMWNEWKANNSFLKLNSTAKDDENFATSIKTTNTDTNNC